MLNVKEIELETDIKQTTLVIRVRDREIVKTREIEIMKPS